MTTGTTTPQFAAVGLVVADMATSLAFYRRLGLDIPADADGEPHVQVALPGGVQLLWDTVENVRSFDPEWSAPTGGSRVALAFRCTTPADVDRTYADLVDAGYQGHRQPWDAVWGMRYAVLPDPDGNSVDLFADLPGSG